MQIAPLEHVVTNSLNDVWRWKRMSLSNAAEVRLESNAVSSSTAGRFLISQRPPLTRDADVEIGQPKRCSRGDDLVPRPQCCDLSACRESVSVI